MPYHVARSETCPAERPYAVVKDDTGEIMGCHPTPERAGAQIGAIERSEAQPAE